MNWMLEFHDSEIIAIHEIGKQLFVFLDGYLHASEGRPGIDEGEGYVQALSFCFDDGVIVGKVEVWPADIYEGVLSVGSPPRIYDNVLNLPAELDGSVRLDLGLCSRGEQLSLRGTKLTVTVLGQPHFVEKFRPKGGSRPGFH